MRKVLALVTVLVMMIIVATAWSVHAETANRMVTYIKIPEAPGPYANARNVSLNFNYNITVLGNVSLTQKCVDLTDIVKKCPGFNIFKRWILGVFDVKLCTIIYKPKAIVSEGSKMVQLASEKIITLSNVGGKVLRVLYLEGAGTYINVTVTLFVWPFFIFEGITYITLSEAHTYINNATGALEGYAYATAAFPQEIVNLVFAIVNRYLPYDWWGITTRTLTFLLDFFDYVAIAAATGLKSNTVSAACLGDICVICKASWNAINGLIRLAQAAVNPKSIVNQLYESPPNCVIVNKTSGAKLNVHQKVNLIVYIYEQYGSLSHSYKISMVVPSCNKYFCIIKFEEKYPIKELDLRNVKPRVVALYTILSKGGIPILNVPRYNVTLYVRETGKVTYNYTHVVSVRSYALMPMPSVSGKSFEISKAEESVLVKLSAPTRTALDKCEKKYYVYYVNGQTSIKVPLKISTESNIYYYGTNLKVKYVCKLNNVTNGKIVSEEDGYATINVNATRDVVVTVYYTCVPASPIPYLESVTCSYKNGEALVKALLENLGASGTVNLIFKSSRESSEKLVNLPKEGSVIVNTTVTAEPGDIIAVTYRGVILGTCKVQSTKQNIAILAIIPVTRYMSVSSIESAIAKEIENGSSLSKLANTIGYLQNENITGIIIVVNGTNTNIEKVEIGSSYGKCSKTETINGKTIIVCKLKKPVKVQRKIVVNVVTNENSVSESRTLNITKVTTSSSKNSNSAPPNLITIENVNATWIDVHTLSIILKLKVPPQLLYRVVTVKVTVPGRLTIMKPVLITNRTLTKTLLFDVNPAILIGAKYLNISITEGRYVLGGTRLTIYNFTYCYLYLSTNCKFINKTIGGSIENATLTLPSCLGNVLCLPGYSKKVVIVTPG